MEEVAQSVVVLGQLQLDRLYQSHPLYCYAILPQVEAVELTGENPHP